MRERLRKLQKRYDKNKHKFEHLIVKSKPMNVAERKQKYRERMTEEAKTAELTRNAEANRNTRQDKRDIEQAPQAPEVSSFYSHGENGTNDSAQQTCAMDHPLKLCINVKCFPAPTYTWTKDGKMIGCEIGGGEVVQT